MPKQVDPTANVLCSSAVSKIEPTFVVAWQGTNSPNGNQYCELYHIFAFRVLPDLNWRNINVARPCKVAVFNISTSEENRIV